MSLAVQNPSAATQRVSWPAGFEMREDGLFWIGQVRGNPVAWRLSDHFEVLGEGRDPAGGQWSTIIRFRDRDARLKTIPIDHARLSSNPGEMRALVISQGLRLDNRQGRPEQFIQALTHVETSSRVTLVASVGWVSDDCFVLPGEVLKVQGAEDALFTGDASSTRYKASGTLDEWKSTVALPASNSALATFAISCAFAGPLLLPLGYEGGGFHVRGASSTGKTSLLIPAASVWGGGGPQGGAHSWRSTANALEGLAHGHSDTFLALDEIGLASPDEVGQVAYALASGQGKARASAMGYLRQRQCWRTLFMSTGEVSLSSHMLSGRKQERTMAGQELRLIELEADAGAGYGIWDTLEPGASAARMSDRIKTAALQNYGIAGPRFVDLLVNWRERAVEHAQAVARNFMQLAHQEGDTGQIERGARRFALVAAAGELASHFRIVPWPRGMATKAAIRVFERWASSYGRFRVREDAAILRALRDALDTHPHAFPFVDDNKDQGLDRPGQLLGRRYTSAGEVRYLITDAGWAQIFAGFDLRRAAELLLAEGFLEPGEAGRFKKKASPKQLRGARFYTIRASIQQVSLDD